MTNKTDVEIAPDESQNKALDQSQGGQGADTVEGKCPEEQGGDDSAECDNAAPEEKISFGREWLATTFCSMAIGALVSLLFYPDPWAFLLVLLGALLFGTMTSICELGILGLMKELRSGKDSRREKAVLAVGFMIAALTFGGGGPLILSVEAPRMVARDIANSAISPDIEMSRNAQIMEKSLPDFVVSAYERDRGAFDDAKFFMLKDASSFEKINHRSVGLGCFKSGQWRLPVVVNFDMQSKDVKFERLQADKNLAKDFDLLCYKIAN